MLKSKSDSVAQIAAEVGYESDPACNRAFKREFGLPPARFRNQAKLARSKPVRPNRGVLVLLGRRLRPIRLIYIPRPSTIRFQANGFRPSL